MRTNIMIKRALVLLVTLALSSSPAMAGDTRKLTLQEAIELSLENNKEIKLNNAKVAEATAALTESRSNRLPGFDLSGSYLRVSQPKLTMKSGASGGQQSGSQGESSGGSVLGSFPKINDAMYGMASVSVPIFSGFRIQNGIESAKYLKKAAELDAVHNRDEVIVNTIDAYCNLYKAKAALEIVKENLKQSKQRVADMENMEKNGLLARNDLLKAKLQESNIELALLDAENNWKITYINMNLMLGLPEDTQLEAGITNLGNDHEDNGFNFWENAALENRTDLKAIEMRRKAAMSGVKAAKGEYYPSVALTGGYIALNVPDFITVSNIINGGIGIKYSPSSLWKTGAKVKQAKARLQQVTISQQMLNDATRMQSAQAYQGYLSAMKKIDVYETAKEQAEENYKIVKSKYDNSLSTTTELLDADVAQLQAKLNYAFAKADAYVSYNKLKQVSGLLDEHEITQQ